MLKSCAKFGGACPRIQSWALGCLANLLGCRANRRRLLGVGQGWGAGATAMSEKSERAAGDRNPHQEERGEEDRTHQQDEDKHLRAKSISRPSGERRGEREGSRGASWVQSGDNTGNDSTATDLGLPHWIHTVLANSDRVACDRGAQYSGIACVREIAAAGRAPARVMKSSGIPSLIGATIEKCATYTHGLLASGDTRLCQSSPLCFPEPSRENDGNMRRSPNPESSVCAKVHLTFRFCVPTTRLGQVWGDGPTTPGSG